MKFIHLIIFTAISVFSLSCNTTKTSIPKPSTLTAKSGVESSLIHNVFFWYKNDADASEIEAFEKEIERLGSIQSIDKFYYGGPAATSERGVVDSSYDLAINVFFIDIAAHDSYQVDPIHLEFIEKCKHLWEKVVVYDNVLK